MIDPLTALAFSILHNKGVYAVLLGSGISRGALIPTGWEITLDLVRRVGKLDGVDEQADWGAWYHQKYGKEPRYTELLDALGSTPDERRAILHGYIEPSQDDIEAGRKVPTKAHRAVANLVRDGFVRVILTTNFDRLIENALRDVGIEPTVVKSTDDLEGAVPLIHSRCYVVKLHGDYLDTRIRNTETELSSYSPEIDALLDHIFDEHGLLVCGWSGEWDNALRAAIARTPNRRYPVYWAARGTPSTLAADIITQRAATVVPITGADSFLTRLADMVSALGEGAQLHPQTVAGAIALAKKYCRDDKLDIQWHEFLADEVAKFRKFLSGPEYPTESPNRENINALIGNIVARTEILRRVLMVCARLGTQEAQQAGAKTITSSALSHLTGAGFACWNSLRDFGASLCFVWSIAGALARDEYNTIHQFTNAHFRTRSGKAVPAVDRLPPMTLESVEWKILNGLEQRNSPVSDFMYALFEQESTDILMDRSEAEELFDRTEFLIALEFAHHRLQRMKQTGLWFWVPLGRFVWRESGDGVSQRLSQFERLPAESPILKAGLLGGTPERAAAAVNAIRDFLKEHAG